jgi:hypothetical protein
MAALYISLYTTVLSEWHVNFGCSYGQCTCMLQLRRAIGPDSKCLHMALVQQTPLRL